MDQSATTTEQQIKEAARRIFHREGLEGARMQAIADEANINKAMLHYYYRSKQKLFNEVFEEDYLNHLAPVMRITRDPSLHLEEMIPKFVRTYYEVMMEHPRLPLFVMHEIAKNPERLLDIARKYGPVNPDDDRNHKDLKAFTMIEKIEEGQQEGRYHPVDPKHFTVSMIGMCTYSVIARPTLKQAFQMSDEQYDRFLEERKEEVVDHAFRILMKPDYYEQRMTAENKKESG